MSRLSSILVVGPTGVVGSYLIPELISQKHRFTRLAAFDNSDRPSSPSKAQALKNLESQGVEIVSGTYDSVTAFKGFDVIFMLLGNHGLHLQPKIIDTAIQAGVRHFYPSEFGADLSVGDNWRQRYYKYKVETRDHLLRRAQDVPDLGWTFIQIGRLTEYSVIKHFGVDNTKKEAHIFGTQEGRQSLLSIKDTIAYTVQTLFKPIGADPLSRRRNLRFQGSSPSWSELFGILERVTGHQYTIKYHPVEETRVKEKLASGLGDVDMELEASHQMVQGSGGTLLPEPYDNWRYPEIQPVGVKDTLEAAFSDPNVAGLLGLIR